MPEKINLELLAFKIDEVIKQQKETCNEVKSLFNSLENRISTLERYISWGKGLLAGLSVVSIATLIKLFFNIP